MFLNSSSSAVRQRVSNDGESGGTKRQRSLRRINASMRCRSAAVVNPQHAPCFAILRQLRCIRRSVPRTVLQSLMSSLVLSRLDYMAMPHCRHLCPPRPTSSVGDESSTARMIYLTSRFNHISPFLRQLNWLKACERIDFKLAVLVYKCLHETGPAYLADELSHTSDFESRRRLRSVLSLNLIVRRTRL